MLEQERVKEEDPVFLEDPSELKESFDSSSSSLAPERKASWQTIGLLIIGDVVGTGILALGNAYRLLGLIPSIILTLFFCPVNVYCGVLMQEIFIYAPDSRSYPMMAKNAFGSKIVTIIVKILYYSAIVFICGQYTQVIASALQGLLINVHICFWAFVLTSVVLLIPLAQVRTLNDSKELQLVNTVSITLVVVISVCYMWAHMDTTIEERQNKTYAEDADFQEPVMFRNDATFADVASALGTLTFAYTGNIIYPEMLAEMKDPKDFHKAFYIAAPYQVIAYLTAATTQYMYGWSGKINTAIPIVNPLYGAAMFLLLAHVLCAYLIKGTILARIVHESIFPTTVNDRGCKGTTHWLGVTIMVALFSAFISISIPDFNLLVDMIADIQFAPLGIILPPLMLLCVRHAAERETSALEYAWIATIEVIGVFLLFGGTSVSIMQAISDLQGTAFSC